LSGEGEFGARPRAAGDLYIFLHVRPHDIFSGGATTCSPRLPIPSARGAGGDDRGADAGGRENGKNTEWDEPGESIKVVGAGSAFVQGTARR
jgi:molecular chaperone DnaJ